MTWTWVCRNCNLFQHKHFCIYTTTMNAMDTENCPSHRKQKAKWEMVATQESIAIVEPLVHAVERVYNDPKAIKRLADASIRAMKDAECEPPKARYKCPKCGKVWKERELKVDETSGDAWCPWCMSECRRIHKKG